MRIGCLQFSPQVGQVNDNISKADEVLDRAEPECLDVLVLPELAFSGYNFSSLRHISSCLEFFGTGISSLWAKNTALKHDCTVIAGYPEKVDLSESWPANPEYYNSAVIVNSDGDFIGNCRKSHLYYTDETWALEGSFGFHSQRIPSLGTMALGICMDINPYKFLAPWNAFEFSSFALASGARLVVVSMAWLTLESPESFNQTPAEPDMETLTYWVSRMEPIIRAESNQEVIIVFANRCGSENEATYAGTSAIVGIVSGEVRVYGILGRGESDLLVVDTSRPPFAKLVYRPEGEGVPANNQGNVFNTQEKASHTQPHPGLNHRAAEPIRDAGLNSTEHDSKRRRNPSYKRTDLTIQLPEKSSKYKACSPSNQNLDSVCGHERKRSEGHSKSRWSKRNQSINIPQSHSEFDRSSVNYEPPPSALLRVPTSRNFPGEADYHHFVIDRHIISTNNTDNIVISFDSLVVEDLAVEPFQSLALKWMTQDDPELAYVKAEDPDALFHDPTGHVGRWVQMIQSPRKPPTEVQHHQPRHRIDYDDQIRGQVDLSLPEKPILFEHRRKKPLKAHQVIRDADMLKYHSHSATGGRRSNFAAVCQKLEEMAQVEAIASQDDLDLDEEGHDSQQRWPTGPLPRASCVRNQNVSEMEQGGQGKLRPGSEHSISFVVDDPFMLIADAHVHNRLPSQLFFSPVDTEPPVSRLKSNNDVGSGCQAEWTDADEHQSKMPIRRFYYQSQTKDTQGIRHTYSSRRQHFKTNKDKHKEYSLSRNQEDFRMHKSR